MRQNNQNEKVKSMDELITSILSKPKTYLPLFALVATWLSDYLLPAIGLPPLTPELKEQVTWILIAIAIYFLRKGTLKTNDMAVIMAALTEQMTKEIKAGNTEQRKKSLQEQLNEIVDDKEKTFRILQLVAQEHAVKQDNSLENATQKVLATLNKK